MVDQCKIGKKCGPIAIARQFCENPMAFPFCPWYMKNSFSLVIHNLWEDVLIWIKSVVVAPWGKLAEVALGLRWLLEFWRCFQSLFGDTDAVQDNNPDGIYTNEIYCGFELAVCLVHSLWHWWSGQIVRHNDKQNSSRMKNSWRNFAKSPSSYDVSITSLRSFQHDVATKWRAVVGIREIGRVTVYVF